MSDNLYLQFRRLASLFAELEGGEGDQALISAEIDRLVPDINYKAAAYAWRLECLDREIAGCADIERETISAYRKKRQELTDRRQRLHDSTLKTMDEFNVTKAGNDVHGLTVVERGEQRFLRVR